MVGQLNRTIPFLAQTKKGTYTTPFLVQNDNDEFSMANSGNAYTVKEGKVVVVEIPPREDPLMLKNIKLPSIAVNTDGQVKYYPFLAFGDNAIYMLQRISKGDTVMLYGRETSTIIPGLSTPRDLLWVKDCRLIRQSNANATREAKDVDDTRYLGF